MKKSEENEMSKLAEEWAEALLAFKEGQRRKRAQRQRTPQDEKQLTDLKEKLEQRRQALKNEGLDELLVEIFLTAMKIKELYKSKKDWEEIDPELDERIDHLTWLEVDFRGRPRKSGYFVKWARVLEAKSLMALELENRNIREYDELFDTRRKDLIEIEKENEFSVEQFFQWQMLASLDEMNFYNSKFSAEAKMHSVQNGFYDNRFQAEMAERMLKVEENTSTLWQLGLLVLVAFFSAVGAPLVQKYVIPVFEKRPSLLIPVGVGLVVVIGLFAFARWAIVNRVIRIRVVKKNK